MKSNETSSVEISKSLGSIYGSMIVFAAVMYFLSSFFSALPTDVHVRAFTLLWIIGVMLGLMGAEIARNLLQNGFSILGFITMLAVNFGFTLFLMVVYADLLPTVSDTAVGMILVYGLAAGIAYIGLALWSLKERRKQ
ncbi:MAG: hypothetical protein ACFE7R_11570 [Candidatus Hodarchaeota archaeon]